MDMNREKLFAYLDDALSEAETAQLEQELRQSELLRQSLQKVIEERDRGEQSLGAIWRRERLTCPNREKLGSFLLQVLEEAEQDYISFHLDQIGCPFCLANLADLRSQQKEKPPQARERRRRIIETSVGLLNNLGKPSR